ncbi:MAG: transporter substrate-binding domain-containing protein [Chloroflexi bacterium]|nr:transporter substrate-binding domain-containing protein [Chloroflexota bacterium]
MKLFTLPVAAHKNWNEINRLKLTTSKWVVFCLFLLVFVLASCSTPEGPAINTAITSIRVGMDNNYPPYAFTDAEGNMQGILVDQWKLWEERAGVPVEIVGLPWDEALQRMKNGEFDVIDTIFYTEERGEVFDFTEAYASIDVRIFFPDNVLGIADAKSLKGFRVAVKSGDANAEYLLEQGIDDLVYYNSYEEIVQAASRQEVTIFVIDEPPAIYFLNKYGIQYDFNYSEPLYGGEFHRAVIKGNTDVLELVNKGFDSISMGEYQAINNRWFGFQYPRSLMRLISYLGIGIGIALLTISILAVFNRSLQRRVEIRTSELEEALKSLSISETKFRASLEFLPIPISIADSSGNILIVNKKFSEHYGYTIADIPTVSSWMAQAYPSPEYHEKVLAWWEKDVAYAVQHETNTLLREYVITAKDGKLHNAEIMMYPIKGLWVASFADVTEHKMVERRVRESEERYRTFFKHSPVPMLEEDFSALKTHLDHLRENGVQNFRDFFNKHDEEAQKCLELVQILDVNDAALHWYRAERKDMLTVNLSRLVKPSEYKSFIDELMSLMDDGKHYKLAISRPTLQGKQAHLIISGMVLPGYEASWSRVLVSILDITESKQAEANLAEAYDTTLEGWAKALELRDKETEGHSRRVTEITLIIARAMGMDEKELVDARRGAILHDIGKMAIPDEILRKNGPLTEQEREIVNLHPQVAYDLLSRIPYLKKALEIPYSHHEKWDGSGYPRGLKGDEIPLVARIFAVADVWDALSCDRPYRKGWEKDKVVQYLRSESGRHFDPKIVSVFFELLDRGEI